jgi:hypothetical protein
MKKCSQVESSSEESMLNNEFGFETSRTVLAHFRNGFKRPESRVKNQSFKDG